MINNIQSHSHNIGMKSEPPMVDNYLTPDSFGQYLAITSNPNHNFQFEGSSAPLKAPKPLHNYINNSPNPQESRSTPLKKIKRPGQV